MNQFEILSFLWVKFVRMIETSQIIRLHKHNLVWCDNHNTMFFSCDL